MIDQSLHIGSHSGQTRLEDFFSGIYYYRSPRRPNGEVITACQLGFEIRDAKWGGELRDIFPRIGLWTMVALDLEQRLSGFFLHGASFSRWLIGFKSAMKNSVPKRKGPCSRSRKVNPVVPHGRLKTGRTYARSARIAATTLARHLSQRASRVSQAINV
jgi:hypothetical protein